MTKHSSKAEDRTQRQCERILAAAEHCFIEHGFHAASMAMIAEAAEMSPGLIYRYFENKNAIILAIIRRQLEVERAKIATLQNGQAFGDRIQDLFRRLVDGDPELMSPVLFLEMTAQTRREPQIAAALECSYREGDRNFGGWVRRTLQAGGLPATDRDVNARLLILRSFIEGLVIRALRKEGPDTDALPEALDLLLPALFPAASPSSMQDAASVT